MIAELREQNLLRLFNSRALEREIAQELAEITKPAGRRGISGSNEAAGIAAIVHRDREAVVARQNRAGAWIKPLPGYITRQTHAQHRLRQAGREEWKAAIRPLLDEERTFRGADADDFLNRSSYDALASGRRPARCCRSTASTPAAGTWRARRCAARATAAPT